MKKLIAFISTSSLFLTTTPLAFATDSKLDQLCDPTTGQFKSLCGFSSGNFGSLLGQLLTFIFVISIVAALFYLVWGGFKWLTSGGDKTAVGAARQHIIAAMVGLIVIFLSYFILNLLVNFFTGSDVSKLNIPTLGQYTGGHRKCTAPLKEKCTVVGGTLVCACVNDNRSDNRL